MAEVQKQGPFESHKQYHALPAPVCFAVTLH
jgi:hypothetical protein